MSLNQLMSTIRHAQNFTPPVNSNAGPAVPVALFESLIPGYSPIHRFILVTTGVDITIFITFFASIWAFCQVVRYVYKVIYRTMADNYMATIHINGRDDIFLHMMRWLGEQPSLRNSRSIVAETEYKSAWEFDDEELDETTKSSADGIPADLQVLNFSDAERKIPPRYVPAFGAHTFWHKGTFFMLHRTHQSIFEGSFVTRIADQEDMCLSCFGRNPEPIKRLLQDAKNLYHQDHNVKTVIRRPAAGDSSRWGSRGKPWVKVANRPCRPMSTVVLDATRKLELLTDINEYLHPATPRWYSNRGIPYRRGYLLFGPPGTGKTSISFALAGLFGLDIYVISLLEPTLTEEDLGQLFNNLPRRCFVLLEDIDTAGLYRDDTKDAAQPDAAKPTKNPATVARASITGTSTDTVKISDLIASFKEANQKTDDDKKRGISLSGLLNAIDGVASHEGRVLIMTTNKPEKLDDALIRPGRVDLQVPFGNATRDHVREIFERMFSDDVPRVRRAKMADHVATPSAAGLADGRIAELASRFAACVPEAVFSPAEIQGFLLKRKKDPERACREVEAWVVGMEEAKISKSKVLGVQ